MKIVNNFQLSARRFLKALALQACNHIVSKAVQKNTFLTVQAWKKKKRSYKVKRENILRQFYDRNCRLIFFNIKHFLSFFKRETRKNTNVKSPSHGTKDGAPNKKKKIFIIHYEDGRMNDEHNISICITRTTRSSFMPCINY